MSGLPYLPVRLTDATLREARELSALWRKLSPLRLDHLYRRMLRAERRRLEREARRRGIPIDPPRTTSPDRRPPRRYE